MIVIRRPTATRPLRQFLSVLIGDSPITEYDVLTTIMAMVRGEADYLGIDFEELKYCSSLPDEVEETWHEGAVKKFFSQTDRKYGFLADGTFFHMDRGQDFFCDGSDQPASGPAAREPKPGTPLLYLKGENRKGRFAATWGSAASYYQAISEINNRPEYRLFRPGTENTLWSGKDISKLRILYPPQFKLEENGYILQKLTKIPDTTTGWDWLTCDDPR